MKYLLVLITLPFLACNDPEAKEDNSEAMQQTEAAGAVQYNGLSLPSALKEISGMTRDGAYLWAISDAPAPVLFKLNKDGKILQQNQVKGVKVVDMESLTSDEQYIYIADVGSNKEKRTNRSVIRIAKSALGGEGPVNGEVTTFSFADNPGDNCEAMLAYGDSLYFFTKRNDGRTRLYSLPKGTRDGIARNLGELDAGGMITGASINRAGNEVALIGYRKGHSSPFVIFLQGFSGTDFLSGKASQHQLQPAGDDWQIESISYIDDQTLSFACEGTKDVPQTLYTVTRTDLLALPEPSADNSSNASVHKDGKKKDKKKKKKDKEE